MLTSLCSSGLGVGDDPSGFDVGEDNWAWSPPSPEISLPSRQKHDNGGTAPSYAGSTTTTEDVGSFSSRLSAYFDRQSTRTEGGDGVAGGAIGHGAGLRAPAYLLQGQGGRRGLRRDDMVERRDSSRVMALEALADELDASLQGIGNPGFGRGSGFRSVRPVGHGGIVSLDLSSAQTLQCALQRRGASFSRMHGSGGDESTEDRTSVDARANGGRRPRQGRARGASYSGHGGAGWRDPAWEKRTDFLPVGSEAAVLQRLFYLSRGITALRVHGDLGRSTFAPECPIELQTFPALQDLRLEGVPLEHVEGLFTLRLQLKSLRFENAPLVSLLALLAPHATAEGVTTTETACRPDATNLEARGLPATSAPYPSSSEAPFGDGYDIKEVEGDWVAAGSGVSVANLDRTRSSAFDVSRERRCSSSTANWKEYRPAAATSQRLSSTAVHTRGQADTATVDRAGRATASGVMGDTVEERARAATWVAPGRDQHGLAGLQLQLGMGTPALRWSLLEVLSICRCGLRELDPSLRLLPRVRRLSLAHNRLSTVNFFQDCAALEELDLSFNCLESVEHVHRVLGNLRSLNLRGNRVTRTCGLERMFSLEEIDLSHNDIQRLEDAARLSSLPLLRSVFLEGNPLEAEERKNYRVSVLSLLYRGRGGELERAAALANLGGIGISLGDFGGGGGDGGSVDVFGAGGIALDGVLSSRKELGELTRLRFASAVEQASPLPSFERASPLDTGKTGATSTDGGRFAPALSPPHVIPSSRATTTCRRSRRRRPRNYIAGRRMLSEEPAAANDESSKSLSLAMVSGDSSPRASAIALDTDRSMVERQLLVAVTDCGESRGGSSLGVMDTTTERSSGGRGVLDDIGRSTSEGAEGTSDAGSRGGERGAALRYGRATSSEIRRRQRDGIVGAVHSDCLPRRMSGSDHVAGSTSREGWTDAKSSAPRRKSTGAVLRDNHGGRRRGTRAVIIEEPEGDAEESGSLSGAIVPEQSLSFCTVPLPREHTPSDAGPSEGDAASYRMKEERAAQNPEIVPEADHQNDCSNESTPIKDIDGGFHATGRPLSLDSHPDSQWECSPGVPVAIKTPSPENPPRLGDSTGVLAPSSLPDQTATAVIAGSDETSPHQQLPSIRQTRCSDSTAGDVSTDLSSENIVVGDDARGNAERNATATVGGFIASVDELKAPLEVSNCEEGVDEGGETRLIAAPAQEGAQESVRVLAEQSTEVSPLVSSPSIIFCKEVLHDLSLDAHRDTLPPTASPDSGDSGLHASSFPSVSDTHGEGFGRHRDGGSSSDGEKEGHEGCAALATVERRELRTGGGTTEDVEGQERGQVEGRVHGSEEDKDESESTAGVMCASGANSAEELEIQSVGQRKEEATEEGGAGIVAEDGDNVYLGDAAYANLLITEHLELYFRQQVFNGAPYLSYSELQAGNLPRTSPHKVVAVVRETALPCLSRRPRIPLTSPVSHVGASGRSVGGNVVASGLEADLALDAWERRSATGLAAAGMARTVHQRGLEGGATGLMMGEVACVIVATERSIFLVDGTFAGKDSLFSEAPRPRVLLVIPLASLERTTIGFRLQKLELHFDVYASEEGSGSMHGAVVEPRGSWSTRGVGGKAPILAAGTGNENRGEHVSVALLTRDRSRTFNLLQTLEPLATKARRALGLPATIVENRDEATLEAISKALPNAPTPTPAFASRFTIGGPSSPDRPKNAGLFGRLGNWVGEIGSTRSGGDKLGGVVVNTEISDGEATLEVDASKGGVLPQSPEKITPSVGNDVPPPPSPALRSGTLATAENMWSTEDGRGESDSGVNGNGVGGGGDGSVVVFQLLMQRWELRPWVVVPRTLVATKEKLALMDEDHTRMGAPANCSLNSAETTRAASPSTPACGGSVLHGGVREKRWSSTAGLESDGKGRRDSGVVSGVVEAVGVGEMACIDVVDLGDVIGVHQEESAPEQVMIDLKGENAFDPRRQWRLQCRTRGSAEIVASAVHRLSLERAKQRKQGSWWNR